MNRSKTKKDALVARYAARIKQLARDAAINIPALRTDDQSGVFASQLLTHTFAELFMHEYPETKWVNGGLINIDTSLDEGMESFAYLEQDRVGRAAIIAPGTTEIPTADVSGKQHLASLHSLAISCSYTQQDLRAAKAHGMFDIVSQKVAAVREGHDDTLDDLILYGSTQHALNGVVRQPGINIHIGGGTWATRTPQQIIDDVRNAINPHINNTDGVETPTSAIFALAPWSELNRRLETGTDTTILAVLKQQFPFITRWDWEVKLKAANSAGNGPAAVFFNPDPRKTRVIMPMLLSPLPPEQRGLDTVLIFESRFGGVLTQRPLSITRLEGI